MRLLKPTLHRQLDESTPESLIPLYVNIVEEMQRPLYFNRLKSHLEDADKETYDIILDIERSESLHNKQVVDFMINLRTSITNAIYGVNESGHRDCNFDLLREYKEIRPDYRPHFILDEIIQYYTDKANGKKTTLRVWRPNPGTFYLSRDMEYTANIGAGDERTMQWILERIESLSIPEELMRMQEEGKRINDLVNKRLRSKAANLILQIDDERFGGKCDFESN